MKRALFTVLGGLLLALLPIRSIAQDYSSGKGLRAALKDKEAKVRTRAAEQLDGYDLKADPEMIAAVVDALKDVDEDVRRLAADALGKLRDTKEAKSYVPMLLEVASKDKSYKVRERAVNSLASFEGAAKGAVPGLIKALGDTDP